MSAVNEEVNTRKYDNSARLARSSEARQAILDAARELMLQQGYRATTISDIAKNADVHLDTVYRLVGRKPLILRELIEHAISGADRAIAAEDRDYVSAIRAEPDARRRLEIYANATRQIHARLAPLLLALRDASTTEPEAREVWREISERRAANMHLFAQDLALVGGLRPGLSVAEAADTIWVTNSAEVYVQLTVEREWSPLRYQQWLVDTWSRVILPDS